MANTQGPWTVTELDPAPEPGYSYGVGGEPVGPSDIPWPVALVCTPADADLIAAAPSMLARLENILADCETWRDDPGDTGEFVSQIEAEARNAITKAKGSNIVVQLLKELRGRLPAHGPMDGTIWRLIDDAIAHAKGIEHEGH